MTRAIACLLLLWWFYRFDVATARVVPDGGVEDVVLCESLASLQGYLALVQSSRPVYQDGKLIGRWQRACVQGPESLRYAAPDVAR